MKLTNATHWSNTFLRRMVGWICKELDMPAKLCREAHFGNRQWRSYRGTAWVNDGRISVKIGPDKYYPTKGHRYGGNDHPAFNERIEALVSVTAHELEHLDQFRRKLPKREWEFHAVKAQTEVLEKFRLNRENLLAMWADEPELVAALTAPKPSIIEKRAMKAQADLARWERKLRLAKTKVAKLRAKVRYYERKRGEL